MDFLNSSPLFPASSSGLGLGIPVGAWRGQELGLEGLEYREGWV